MAKVQDNLVLMSAHGPLGEDLSLRHTRHGVVVAIRPGKRRTEASPAQKEQIQKFRAAVVYAQASKHRPEYQAVARKRNQTSFTAAIKDFMHPPEIGPVNVSALRGLPGDGVSVRAFSNVMIKNVNITILAQDNVLVEKGSMAPDRMDTTRWSYTTTASAPHGKVRIVIEATDLPGHTASREQTLTVQDR